MSWISKVIDRVYSRVANKLRLQLRQCNDLTPPLATFMFTDPDRLDGSRNIREFVCVGDSMVSWLIPQGLAPSHRIQDDLWEQVSD